MPPRVSVAWILRRSGFPFTDLTKPRPLTKVRFGSMLLKKSLVIIGES
jgi:hypothetical protein